MEEEDYLLLRKIVNQDKDAKEAFELLYDKYAKLVKYIISNHQYDNSYADDLSQDVWEKIFKKADTYKKDTKNNGSAKSWICQIARNHYFDYLRRKKQGFFGCEEPTGEVNSKPIYSNESVTEPHYDSHEKSIVLNDCITKGTKKFAIRYPACYRIIQIIAFDNLTMKELAELLGKKEGATRQQVSYCKKNFWEFIKHCLESA